MSRFLLSLFILAITSLANAQGTPPSDPQAVTLAAQSIASLTGGLTISDATLNGTVAWTVGSDQQSGSAILLAKGFGESRVDLNLNSGNRSEIRNVSGNPNEGNWIGADGAVHAIALHNCFIDASWFFPALGTLAAAGGNPNVVLAYVGLENFNQTSLQHIHAYTYDVHLSDAQQLSAMDFYLDPQTFLPTVVTFNEHPDSDQTVDISVQLMFSDYRSVNGVRIPFHIQRYVNNSLMLDVQLTSVALNSGVSDNQFAVQ
jgi:hypothetical protein